MFLLQSIDSNASLFWKHPHRYPKNSALPVLQVFLNPVKLTPSEMKALYTEKKLKKTQINGNISCVQELEDLVLKCP
jgi:hypothetical protein